MKQELLPEEVAVAADGKAILGYVIPKDKLGAFWRDAERAFAGQPFLSATKTEGETIKVKIWGVSLTQAEQAAAELLDYGPAQIAQGSSASTFSFLED